ncbi:MAG: TonB-dependent receptor [Ferruginibacter sp.]|nr:TonB-dependent receptor [Ferruginibacter sp.]
MKRKNYKRKIIVLLCTCISLLLLSTRSMAQEAKKITGKVVSQVTGKAVSNATVVVKGSLNTVAADENGNFVIYASNNETLEISSVSFITQTVKVTASLNQVRVSMIEDYSKEDEVVVIGYGKLRRKDVTGSISSITGAEIVKTQPTTIDQALQGKVAGVVVQQVSGQPGGGVSVQIRGLSSFTDNPPLYVIDGVLIPPNAQAAIGGSGSNPLSSINPSEVASIDILKDASATAIYGSQATNGVIVITTKRGQVSAPKITYDGYWGQQKLPKYYDVMNLRDYATFMNEKSDIIGYDKRPQFANPQYLGNGTNWQKALFRTADMQNHTVGVSGGDARTQYFLSGSYFSQDGIAVGSNFKRTSIRLNLDNKTTDWLKVGTSLQLANVAENLGSSNNANEVIRTALNQTPDVNIKNPDGTWDGNDPNIYGAYSYNPYALASLRTHLRNRYQIFGNIYAEIALTKGLSLRNEVSGNFDFATEDQFTPTMNFGTSAINVNSGSYQSAHNFYYNTRSFLTYNKMINGNLWLNALAGHESQLGKNESASASRTGFPSNNVRALNSGDALTSKNTGYKGQYAQESYFGRVNLTYNERYLLTMNLRSDGSSKFAATDRWVTTYSGAFAWRINKEGFMKNITAVNELKLRLGYGLTNNQNIRDYAFGSTLNTIPTALSGVSQITAAMGNPIVKWEKTTSYNIGLDVGILKGRISFSGDYYDRQTNDLLLSLTLPLYSGTVDATGYAPGSIQSPYVNIGAISNKGYDLSLTTINITNKIFTWRTGIVLSHNVNKVISLNTDGASLLGYAGSTVVAKTSVGRSIGEFVGYQTEGIFMTAADFKDHALPQKGGLPIPITNGSGGVWLGDVKFKDLNGDGKIDENDQTYLGSPRPKFQFGFNNSFTYKNFDLNIFMSGNIGNKVFNQVRVAAENPNQNFGYFRSVLDYAKIGMINATGSATDINNLQITNNQTKIVRISQASGNDNQRFSDKYVEDASFARCKNITVGFTLPKNLLAKAHINSLRLYANVANVFTITKYTGYDPEIGSWNPLAGGIDNGYYAQPRVFTIGANLSLNK